LKSISLLLMNIRVDLPIDLAVGDSDDAAFPMAKSTARALWHMKEDSIIVCPYRVRPEYVDHVTDTLGIDPQLIRLLFVDSLLWDELLASPEIWDSIQTARKELDGEIVEVNACFQTRGVVELRRKILGSGPTHAEAFLAEGGAAFFNRKSLFRKIAASQGLPLPAGAAVRGADAVLKAVEEFLPITGTVIGKRDNAWSGLGNFAVSDSLDRPIQGVNRAYRVEEVGAADFIESLYSEMCMLDSEVIVVEAYHPATTAFFFEYCIRHDGQIDFLQSFEMKHRPAGDPQEPWRTEWTGLEMPADIPPQIAKTVQAQSEKYFRFAADMGYRGYIHLDAILLEDGRVLFNETNARWSGGTVLHHIGSRLLGEAYRDSFLSSYRLLPAVSGATLYPQFEQSPFILTDPTVGGSVIVICDPEGGSETEALVMYPTREAVIEGEAQLAEYLTTAVGATEVGRARSDF
jgi:hypothetical protein